MAKPKKAEVSLTPKKPVTQMKAAVVEPPTSSQPLTEEQVRMKAYEYYTQRNGNGGTPEDDWYRAEEELRGKTLRGKSA